MLPRTTTRGKPPVRVAGRRRDPSLQDTDLPELRAGVGEAWAGRPRGGCSCGGSETCNALAGVQQLSGCRFLGRGVWARPVEAASHLSPSGGILGWVVGEWLLQAVTGVVFVQRRSRAAR